jgi:L-alanine-DL-glutamate epimerase-like enolase superfamily enzyme
VPDRGGSGAVATRAVVDRLKEVAVGRDVLDTAVIWQEVYQLCTRLYDRRGLAIHALSGIDMAVHDAAARSLGVPLCQQLGGRFREEVAVYVSSVWVDGDKPEQALTDTERYVEAGHRAIKYYGWLGFGGDPSRDAALLLKLRRRAGEGVDLMLDLGRPASLSEAIQMARLIESSGAGIRWWEEPLDSVDDAGNLTELTARTDVTIAAGESELTAFAFRDLIEGRRVDLVQPDLSWVGGLTEARRIAELARLHRVPLVPHNWGTAINFAASIHLVAAMPQGFLCEYPITPRTWGQEAQEGSHDGPSPMMVELVGNPLVISGGRALVPSGPGLGVELDEDALERYTV